MKTVLTLPRMSSAKFTLGCTAYRLWSCVAIKLNMFIRVALATIQGFVSDMCLLDTC